MRVIVVDKRTYFPDTSSVNEDCFYLYHGIFKRFGTYEKRHVDDIRNFEEKSLDVILNSRGAQHIRQPSLTLVAAADVIRGAEGIAKHLWKEVRVEKEYDAPFEDAEFLRTFMPKLAAGRAIRWILKNAGPPVSKAAHCELMSKVSRSSDSIKDRFAKITYMGGGGEPEDIEINLEHLRLDGVTRLGSTHIFVDKMFKFLASSFHPSFFSISEVTLDVLE
jgi:hypothetical protein